MMSFFIPYLSPVSNHSLHKGPFVLVLAKQFNMKILEKIDHILGCTAKTVMAKYRITVYIFYALLMSIVIVFITKIFKRFGFHERSFFAAAAMLFGVFVIGNAVFKKNKNDSEITTKRKRELMFILCSLVTITPLVGFNTSWNSAVLFMALGMSYVGFFYCAEHY